MRNSCRKSRGGSFEKQLRRKQMAGVKIGNIFGARYKTKAEIAGGVILMLLGLKILLEHLGIL